MKRTEALIVWSRFSMLLLLALALLLGLIRSLEAYNPRYALQWSGSRWISTDGPAAAAYFRATLDHPGEVDKAVIQLAATDSFELFVNGVRVGSRSTTSTVVSGVFDLGHLLQTGRNVLAVRVAKASYPSRPGLRFELTVVGGSGQVERYASSPLVKVVSELPAALGSELRWQDTGVDDASWPVAKLWPGPTQLANAVVMDPATLLVLPRPETKTLINSQGWRMAFERQIEVTSADRVWVGFASSTAFEVAINGVPTGLQPAQSEAIAMTPVNHLLHPGSNRIRVEFAAGSGNVEVAGGVIRAGQALTLMPLSSDWPPSDDSDVATESTALAGLEQNKPASLHPVVADAPQSQRPLPLQFDPSFARPSLWQLSPLALPGKFVLGLVVLLWWPRVFSCTTSHRRSDTALDDLLVTILPANLLVAVLLLLAWLLGQDIRLDARQIFSAHSLNWLVLLWWGLALINLATVPSDDGADEREAAHAGS